jgi:phage terminase large subunit
LTTALQVHRYAPRGAAKAMLTDRSPELLLDGPAGTGKSRACLEKLLLCAVKYPGMRALIVRQTLVSLSTSAMVTWQQHVAKEMLATGQMVYYGGSRNEPAQYRLNNGSQIMLAGMDKPSKIMSTEYDMVYVQELTELQLTAWLALSSRMRNPVMPYRQLLADCNPDADTHWVNQRANSGAIHRLISRHVDNPVYYREDGTLTPEGAEYMARLDALTGVTRLRLRDGLWVSAEGVIYEGWNPGIHLIDRAPAPGGHIPLHWPRFWVVDFGYTNPFVWQCWARDDDGRLYMYREIYMTRRTVKDHCEKIKSLLIRKDGTWVEPKPQKIICDHDAEDRATLEQELGLVTTAATKTVKDGIDAVMARMVPAGDGKPRIFVLRNALVEKDQALALAMRPTRTAEEFPLYVWNEAKDQPIKEHDHGMDTTRYMVADQDLSPQYRVRWIG